MMFLTVRKIKCVNSMKIAACYCILTLMINQSAVLLLHLILSQFQLLTAVSRSQDGTTGVVMALRAVLGLTLQRKFRGDVHGGHRVRRLTVGNRYLVNIGLKLVQADNDECVAMTIDRQDRPVQLEELEHLLRQ
eukprot:TRINITY_DN11236_c0_g2_i1.p1 TRINITY_DN11236_c0_g2~~TRINITY_DN11236_c0_g2_i1.p1  ORF type:complete len:134 (+),score=15.55 TRINITY_DN11236_c0_g2_i1:542-943(+)